MNVVCHERGCCEQVSHKRGLFRAVCYEQVCLKKNHTFYVGKHKMLENVIQNGKAMLKM